MWQIMIDVSGMPPDDVHVGLILFNYNYKTKFISELYKAFPYLLAYEKKSTRVREEDLLRVLQFFDEKRLLMVAYQFKNHRWKQNERRINELFKEVNPSSSYRTNFYKFNEKLLGIIYYYAITHVGKRSDVYNVTVCHESSIDIWIVLKTLRKLAKRDGWDIRPNTSIRSVEHLLKMADYVAGASRQIEEFKLNTVGRYRILKDPIKDSDLKYVFKIRQPQYRKVFKEQSNNIL